MRLLRRTDPVALHAMLGIESIAITNQVAWHLATALTLPALAGCAASSLVFEGEMPAS